MLAESEKKAKVGFICRQRKKFSNCEKFMFSFSLLQLDRKNRSESESDFGFLQRNYL